MENKALMKEIGQDSRGNHYYLVEDNGAGGRTYYSDSIGGGVMIYDTSLISEEDLQFCIAYERKLNNGKYNDTDKVAKVDTRPWVGIDFDGTIAEYHGWLGPTVFGGPIPAMVKLVQKFLDDGVQVKIFTARMTDPRSGFDTDVIKAAIQRWCIENIGQSLEVTNRKDFYMICLFDDRAVGVESNTGRLLSEIPTHIVLGK